MDLKLKLNDPQKAKEFFEAKLAFTTGPVELDYCRKNGGVFNIIDTRASEDYVQEHIPDAVNLPEDSWDTFEGLSKDKLNVLYCYSHVCHLASRAAVKFASHGYPVMEMDGGFKAWKDHDLEVERGAPDVLQPAA